MPNETQNPVESVKAHYNILPGTGAKVGLLKRLSRDATLEVGPSGVFARAAGTRLRLASPEGAAPERLPRRYSCDLLEEAFAIPGPIEVGENGLEVSGVTYKPLALPDGPTLKTHLTRPADFKVLARVPGAQLALALESAAGFTRDPDTDKREYRPVVIEISNQGVVLAALNGPRMAWFKLGGPKYSGEPWCLSLGLTEPLKAISKVVAGWAEVELGFEVSSLEPVVLACGEERVTLLKNLESFPDWERMLKVATPGRFDLEALLRAAKRLRKAGAEELTLEGGRVSAETGSLEYSYTGPQFKARVDAGRFIRALLSLAEVPETAEIGVGVNPYGQRSRVLAIHRGAAGAMLSAGALEEA